MLERFFYILGHLRRVAAKIEVGPILKPLIELRPFFEHPMLNVDSLVLIAREGGVDPEIGMGFPLLLVEIIAILVALAEKEPVASLCAMVLALLHKGAEGGDAGAGPYHDDGGAVVVRKAEVVGRLHEERDRGFVNFGKMAQEVACDAVVLLAALHPGEEGDSEIEGVLLHLF